MKLKIKNLDKITGTYESLQIDNVSAYNDRYVFHCARIGERTTYDIVLSRDGYKDHEGDWVYHFHDGRHKTQSITPDWFKDIGNAVSAVVSEFESQYFL